MANTAQINIKVDSKQADNSVNQLNQDLQGTVKQTTTLKAQLRAMQNELNTLDEGSARFRELTIAAGKLKDQIKDTQDVIASTAGTGLENLGTALNGVASIGIAGFQAVTAAQALFGTESEEIQKQLLKIQAIAGLADAVKVVGGLGDTMTQIKASATAAAQSMGILTTATVAETAATEGAEVAQEGLNTAMKLNPVGAIIAGLIALTTAVIAFSGSSKELTKEEKKRRQEIEAINKAQKEAIKTIGEESGKFVGLIYQLKESNKGSKERKDLIKEINKEYGTTLKNIDDETEFQRLLNKEVEDYIAYQTVKLRIQKNEEAFNLVLTRKLDLETKIQQAQSDAERVAKKLNITVGEYYRNNSEVVKSLEQWNKQLSGAEFKLNQYTKRINVLKDSEYELTDGNKKYGEQQDKTTKTQTENIKTVEFQNSAYLDYLKTLESVDKELQKVATSYGKSIQIIGGPSLVGRAFGFSLSKEESEKQERALISFMDGQYTYVSEKLMQVQQEVDDLYKSLQESETRALQEELDNLTKQLTAKIITQQEFSDGVAKIEEEHYKRVASNETEYYTLLKLKSEEAKNEEIRLNKILYDETKKIREQSQIDTYEFQKAQALKEIDDSEMNEIKKEEAKRKIRLEYAKKEEKLLLGSLSIQKEIRTKQYEKEYVEGSQNLVEQEKRREQYNADILKMEQDTQTQISALYDDTTISLKDSLVEKANQYLQYFDMISGAFSNFTSAFQAMENAATQNRLNQIKTIYDAEVDANEKALANKSITDDEYNARKTRMENAQTQKEKQLALKTFQTNKRFNIAQATMDGATAVLSAFANTPGGIVIKSVAAGLAGIFAAMQVMAIESTEFYAAKGGIVPQNGMPSNIDSVNAKLAPGETVINSNSSQMFPELLNLINMAGGGNNLLPNQALPDMKPKVMAYKENQKEMSVRAYVVEQDITSSQQRVKRIQNSTTF